jgi:hypothetical protein
MARVDRITPPMDRSNGKIETWRISSVNSTDVDGKEIVRTIVIVRLPPRVRDETAKKFTRDK